MGLTRSTYYRLLQPQSEARVKIRRKSQRALSDEERQAVIAVLHEERFMDQAPAAIFATLLDEGIYLCSIRTMYRILSSLNEVKERRNQRRHPEYKKPELIATAPNQVWSWDITKLKGPEKWNYFYLYVILDIYSRYVVGWTVASRESGELAKHLIEATCARQDIDKNKLTIHSDRGSPMKSKTVALLLTDLGVLKSFNRPHVSNDNPFSESQFKTVKTSHRFPSRFGCIQDARANCRQLLQWYNHEHYHGGIALMTPYIVHSGGAQKCSDVRQQVLSSAHDAHPERFVKGPPKALLLPEAVWINKPKIQLTDSTIALAHAVDCEL
jgi:putative transposase